MDTLKNAWAKVEEYWGIAVGWIAAHPKTTLSVIVVLVAARLFFK